MYFKAHSRKVSAKKSLTGFCFRKYGHQEELEAVVLSLRREVWKVYKGLSGFSFLSVFCQPLVLSAEGQKLSSQKQHSGSRHQNESPAHSCSVLRKQTRTRGSTGAFSWLLALIFLFSHPKPCVPYLSTSEAAHLTRWVQTSGKILEKKN